MQPQRYVSSIVILIDLHDHLSLRLTACTLPFEQLVLGSVSILELLDLISFIDLEIFSVAFHPLPQI